MKKRFIVEAEEGTTIGCSTCKLQDCCIGNTGVYDVLPFLNCSNYNLDTIVIKEESLKSL